MKPAVNIEKKHWTYQDYLKLDDDKRYEILEGELIMVPSPLTTHQLVSGNLYLILRISVDKKRAGKVLDAPLDVVLAEDIVVQPDLMFISNERSEIVTEKNISSAPDLVIEITSPQTGYYDLIRKKKIYEKYGVKEYWIVDPETKLVEIYKNQESKFLLIQTVSEEGEVSSQVIKGFKINVREIFQI